MNSIGDALCLLAAVTGVALVLSIVMAWTLFLPTIGLLYVMGYLT